MSNKKTKPKDKRTDIGKVNKPNLDFKIPQKITETPPPPPPPETKED